MRTIREWASYLPEEFEVSILSQSKRLDLKQRGVYLSVGAFKKWDETLEGYAFWDRVWDDLFQCRELSDYEDYLTNDSDIEAIYEMQGWDKEKKETEQLMEDAVSEYISKLEEVSEYCSKLKAECDEDCVSELAKSSGEDLKDYHNTQPNDSESELKKAFEEFNSFEPSGNRYKLEPQDNSKLKDLFNLQPHYDNSKGSLYKIAEERGWDSYQFDLVKRIDRAYRKGKFEEDVDKSIDLLRLWKMEKGQ